MFSNRYIFIYASVMVIIVALLLSLAATILQPFQQRNLEVEKMKDILGAAHITAQTKDVPSAYDAYVVEEIVVDELGNIVASFAKGKFNKGEIRAFNINIKEQLQSIEKTGKGLLPLYVVDKEGVMLYVIPLLGRGLWGPIWGTIALKDDLSTVAGVTFGHKGETPGLGAEISTIEFQEQFNDKQIFDKDQNFVSVAVVKGGVKNSSTVSEIHGVDAISGGTITCDGTTDMIRSNLENYLPFFEKIKNNGNNEE
jgi:Na+-transporting NADH:ubiquinone oxidoreductase subunit C